MKAKWEFSNKTFSIVLEDGTQYSPSASQIYNYIFSNIAIKWKEIPLDLNNDDLIIGTSRIPVDFELHLNIKKANDETNIYGELLVKTKTTSEKIDDLVNREANHIIIDNIWYPFPKGIQEEVNEFLKFHKLKTLESISIDKYLSLISSSADISFNIIDHVGESISSTKIRVPEYESGDVFVGNLYTYQKHGYRWMRWLTNQGIGCILADEMGLGKTIQIIALLADKVDNINPSLVIAPATLLENWKREFKKFSPSLKTTIHRGGLRTGFPSHLKSFNVVITSYGTVLRDKYMLRLIEWEIIALDEAQAIKNREAKRTKAIKKFSKKSGIAITGTPIQNRLSDIWSLMDFTNQGYLGNYNEFELSFDNTIMSADELEGVISPLLLRREVHEVADDLPPRIDIPQFIEMARTSINEYEKVRENTIEEYGKRASFVALGKLRQFCCHPYLLEDDSVSLLNSPTYIIDNSMKYQRLIEITEEIFASGQKVIIFTSYKKMIDILNIDLSKRFNAPVSYIDGRVKVTLRQGIIDDFNDFIGSACLALNPIAAGTGLNITGANHVIHYNPEWNPAIEDQATARAYRIGQELPVTVHRLIYANTVEEIMDQRLEMKRALADKAVVGTDINNEDIKSIIKALSISPLGGEADETR